MNKTIRNFLFGSIIVGGLASCGGASNTPSPLIAQSERIGGELATLVEGSPMFLQSADVNYADGVLGVSIAFSDSAIEVEDCSDALVQYVLAQYLKAHGGPDLDVVLNTLTDEEGSLKLTLVDSKANSREYTVNAARLKHLVRTKPMELSYNDVRTNVMDILDERCDALEQQYKAEDAEFTIKGGFAQYTLTFARPSAFSHLNQASLRGRYLKDLKAQYENYGACRAMVEELLQSLSIDGYRYVYTDKNETKVLNAAIPWNLID